MTTYQAQEVLWCHVGCIHTSHTKQNLVTCSLSHIKKKTKKTQKSSMINDKYCTHIVLYRSKGHSVRLICRHCSCLPISRSASPRHLQFQQWHTRTELTWPHCSTPTKSATWHPLDIDCCCHQHLARHKHNWQRHVERFQFLPNRILACTHCIVYTTIMS